MKTNHKTFIFSALLILIGIAINQPIKADHQWNGTHKSEPNSSSPVRPFLDNQTLFLRSFEYTGDMEIIIKSGEYVVYQNLIYMISSELIEIDLSYSEAQFGYEVSILLENGDVYQWLFND